MVQLHLDDCGEGKVGVVRGAAALEEYGSLRVQL